MTEQDKQALAEIGRAFDRAVEICGKDMVVRFLTGKGEGWIVENPPAQPAQAGAEPVAWIPLEDWRWNNTDGIWEGLAANLHPPAQPAQAGAEPVGVVRQFRKMRCADWYDGLPDHEDGGGPYETRTLYTHPPARVPLTDEQIGAAINAWFEYDIVAGQRSFAERMRSAIEAAHGIGGGK